MKVSVGTKLFWNQVGLIFWLTMIEAWNHAAGFVDKSGGDLPLDAQAHLRVELFLKVMESWLGLFYVVINLLLVGAGVRIVKLLIEQRFGNGTE